jgi:hypothetical protein
MPDDALALRALETFKTTRQHAALAADVYTVVHGPITDEALEEAKGEDRAPRGNHGRQRPA